MFQTKIMMEVLFLNSLMLTVENYLTEMIQCWFVTLQSVYYTKKKQLQEHLKKISSRGSEAYPSNFHTRGRVLLGQVSSPSQGQQLCTVTLLPHSITPTCMFLDCGGSRSTRREPIHAQGDHETPHRKAPTKI